MSLQPIREEIDRIDEQIVELFKSRMECSRKVAEYKNEHGLEVFNKEREEQLLEKVETGAGIYGDSARQLYTTILELSRALQHDMVDSGRNLKNQIYSAEKVIPTDDENVKVACFGVEGSYANQATMKAFPNCKPDFYSSFQDIFSAICNEQADFGVVPIENSSAGSVTDVYDLMLKYRFYISMVVDIPINHVLAMKKGANIGDLKKIYSHQQALSQCSDFFFFF